MSSDVLSVQEALALIEQQVSQFDNKQTVILPNALNRTLAEDIISPINVPNFNNSAMDGYGFRYQDLPEQGSRSFKIIGQALAGQVFEQTVAEYECVRIMTGARIPEGVDTVIEQEKTEQVNDLSGEANGLYGQANGFAIIASGQKKGANVRYIGEDIARDSIVLPAGSLIGPAQMGVLASLGIASVKIRRKPRVAVFSSGDEIRSIGETLEGNQIYDSNRYTISGLLNRLSVEVIDLGVIPDTQEIIDQTLKSVASEVDMIITSGGVSVGDADYIKQALDKNGEIYFSKLHLKPGRPLTFGHLDNTLFFGLPGNPVAVMVTFMYFVRPALLHLLGRKKPALPDFKVMCQSDIRKVQGRTEIQRGILQQGEDGLTVHTTGKQGSGVLSSMSRGNCFIYLPHNEEAIQAGEQVIVHPFSMFD